MRELSLHILDIVQNSITAKADTITVEISENIEADELKITISDNGCGMDEETLARVNGTFATSRTTRKIGMGIALFRAAAELSDGYLTLASKKRRRNGHNGCFQTQQHRPHAAGGYFRNDDAPFRKS